MSIRAEADLATILRDLRPLVSKRRRITLPRRPGTAERCRACPDGWHAAARRMARNGHWVLPRAPRLPPATAVRVPSVTAIPATHNDRRHRYATQKLRQSCRDRHRSRRRDLGRRQRRTGGRPTPRSPHVCIRARCLAWRLVLVRGRAVARRARLPGHRARSARTRHHGALAAGLSAAATESFGVGDRGVAAGVTDPQRLPRPHAEDAAWPRR